MKATIVEWDQHGNYETEVGQVIERRPERCCSAALGDRRELPAGPCGRWPHHSHTSWRSMIRFYVTWSHVVRTQLVFWAKAVRWLH